MKTIVVACLVLFLWATSVEAQSNDMKGSAHWSETESTLSPESVIPGQCEADREALLTKLNEAKKQGVGIRNYMTEFLNIENMVRTGSSEERINVRIKSLSSSLSNQLAICEHNQVATTASSTGKDKLIGIEEARRYVLRLVNTDRAEHHRSSLVLDSIASVAAQLHSDEMARLGYCSHWDIAGRKPNQRYTEAGGLHNISENVGLSFKLHSIESKADELKLEKDAAFSIEKLRDLEHSFMNEQPPNDGHRVQILGKYHNKLGIGLSASMNAQGESFLCLVEEFIDQYGQYSKLPKKIVRGKPFDVAGILVPGAEPCAVSIQWEPEPKPMTIDELKKTHSYSIPGTSIMNYPLGHKEMTVGRNGEGLLKGLHFSNLTEYTLWQRGFQILLNGCAHEIFYPSLPVFSMLAPKSKIAS